GDHVWVDVRHGVPVGARVKALDGRQVHLLDDEGKERCVSESEQASLRLMHPTSVEGVDDMIRLGDLTEAGVLRNLLIRHRRDIIYTYIGSVLVAVNPYQLLPIYTGDQVRLYHGRRLGELPPHVFAIADCCYYNMQRNQRNQCCIISGESGAGKTESTKLILQFLAAVSGQHSWIEQQILQSNPVLEAFGNAKTTRNDNSSRFGKYIEIFFNKDGVIEGAHIEQYLLEKSRVCHQGSCITCDGRDDAEEFERIRTALRVLTFSDRECWEIFKLLAAILHLGNIKFEGCTVTYMDACEVLLSDHFTAAAKLLEVDKEQLEASLTSHTIVTKQEQLTKPLSSEQALDCRDALAKAVYTKLFMWIFGKMNGAIHKQPTNSSYTQRSIGLLDIFGFENFRVNSFEQLCINYANEQLQQFFVEHIFRLEQEEYLKEGVKWRNISYSDNQHTLDLLASQPLNLLSLIDEETHFPKGTDKSMLEKMNSHHGRGRVYIPPKANHILEFGVRHFAGVVYYDCKGFLEKNRDVLSLDIIAVIQKSSSKMLKLIFETELNACRTLPVTNNNNNNNNNHHRRVIIKQKKPTRPSQQASEQRRQISTLSGQFRQSLDSLMKALSLCQPFFIRCFKPNDNKLSMVFDRDLCMEQLRYSGVLETIKIRKLGYPIQHRFEEFLRRYRVLLKSTECDPSKESVSNCCVAICRAVIKSQDDWRIGKTKIFLKLRQGLMRLQALVRARKGLLQYQRERAAAVALQKQTRRYLAAKDLKRKQDAAAVLLQAQTRGLLARRQLKHLKDDAFLSAQERRERQELANVDLQLSHGRTVLQTKETQNKQEEKQSEEEMVEDMFRFLPKSTERQEVLRESVTREEQIVEPERDEVTEKAVQIVVTPVTADDDDDSDEEEEEKKQEEDEDEDYDDYDDDDYDDEEFSFAKFAAMHFQRSATHTYIQQRLKSPLLYHEDEGEALVRVTFFFFLLLLLFLSFHCHAVALYGSSDLPSCTQACLTVWWIILRFMGDISEQRTARMSLTPDIIQQHLGQRQGRRLSHFVGLDQKILRKKQKQNNKRKHSTIMEEGPEDIAEEDDVMIGEGPSLDRPMTTLEKLHIIVGYGLRRPHIRDEIYCQILKQLSRNTDRTSRRKGWTLLSMCLGIFPPTELLIRYVEHFIHRGPAEFSSSCAERLQRTLTNGERKEVPCWIELNAMEMKKPMKVDVTLTDGRVLTLPIDSASISSELCRAVAKKINLKDTFGFSIYISYRDKNWSLGSTGQHVLDAICQCEQEERRQGQDESAAPWGLAFRKEFFTPWHDCTDDPISTELIYTQIIHDLQSGEYQCEEEDDYVQLAAKHYYIKYGKESSRDKARSIVWECLSLNLIENKSEVKLVRLVGDAHEKDMYVNSGATPDSVKAEVVEFARLHWPIYFSKFYEVSVISGVLSVSLFPAPGPSLPEQKLVVAVNWSGISFQEGKERTFLKLSYTRLTGVQLVSEGRTGEVVCLSTLRDEYKLVAAYAHNMVELLSKILNGLKERSVYAVALQDCNRPDDATFLSFKKDDLINIIKDGQYASGGGWINGRNDRTGQSGAVSTDAIMTLHTLRRPSDDVLGSRKSLMMVPSSDDVAEKVAQFSLKEFSYEFF
ncbi:unconventional myosin-VIIa-like, partial [Clarias magur]